MKKNNSIKYIIAVTLLLLFVGAPFFNWIATNKWQWRFINESNYDAWIGYYGAIIGGALTLGGVWWTINDTEEKRKEDLYSSHKPFLEVTPIESKYSPDYFNFNTKWKMNIYIKDNCDDEHFIVFNNDFLTSIKIKNVGLGMAKNIIFSDYHYTFFEITDPNIQKTPKKLPFELNIDYQYKIPYLLNGNSEEIPIIFLTSPENMNSNFKLLKPIEPCQLTGSIKIFYSDLYENWYAQKMNFSFVIKYSSSIGFSITVEHIYLQDAKKINKKDLINEIY